MDFKISEELVTLQNMFKDFCENEARPLAGPIDDYVPGAYATLCQKVADAGFLGLVIPEEYGGSNAGYMAYALCLEELSKASAACGKACSGQTNMCYPIIKYGTEEQKHKYVTGFVNGTMHGCFTITEPGAGSDAAAMATTGEIDGDYYVINGTKAFITGADKGNYFITFFKLKDTDGELKPTCVIIDKGTPGLTVGRAEDLTGVHSSGVCEVTFENCRVPISNRVGRVGEGFHVAMAALDAGRLGIACVAVGTAQDAIDQTIKYTKERVQFGKSISSFQNTQFKLAELQTKVDAARLLCYRAACALDANERATHLCSMAKLFASDVLNEVARSCVQFHGGYGYTHGYAVERIYRDAKIFEIFEGTSEIQKKVIARWMGVK